MTYNMDFLIAALLFLLIVLIHLVNQKELIDFSSRVFSTYMLVGVADIFFDIVSSFLMERGDASLVGLTELVLTFFYLMQSMVIYFVLYYTKSQETKPYDFKKKELIGYSIPVILMAGFILLNHFTHFFFYFTSDGTYHKGRGYLFMYVFALFYVVLLIINNAINRKYLGKEKRKIINELLVIMAICVVVQAFGNGVLTTGLGIGLGIVLLALTINNPHGYMDHLTGAYNSSYFSMICGEMIDRKQPFHVLVVVLQNMKQVNVVYGIQTGDQYLKEMGKILLKNSGHNPVFRMNGSRFAVVLGSDNDYNKLLGAVIQLSDTMLMIDDREIPIRTTLCGIPNGHLMKRADTLWSYCNYLFDMKTAAERSTFVQSTGELIDKFYYEEQIEQFLNEAIEKDLFEICLQPVYSPEKGCYISAEILSRLSHPTLGPIRPDLFISIAERNGQITNITGLQFERACRFIHDNPVILEKLENVKFNFSPADLLKRGTAGEVLRIMDQYEIPRSFVQAEITETVATEYRDSLLYTIKELGEAGIKIVLDDFGSGYANMNTVLKLPFTCIKMDRSLLDGIGTDKNATLFYQNIVGTLRNMGYSIVAEGVSEESEMKLVTEWGVDMIQGFYYSRPLSGEDFLQLIAGRSL